MVGGGGEGNSLTKVQRSKHQVDRIVNKIIDVGGFIYISSDVTKLKVVRKQVLGEICWPLTKRSTVFY